MLIKSSTALRNEYDNLVKLAKENGEPIYITRNGKTVAKMVNPNVSAVETISGMLAGKLADDYDAQMLREERLAKYEDND